ncbi:MAG: ABC transporter ATP-binding protein [Ectothiorhodospiraceae bacterium]|nr:ABC transporter ATP-binding protein [Ectothiorhodospiraceae bacterium]MCH8505921.1 ABC transporter ATP-binding protein [Ectothiorhodospiraceae bacterium]
MEATNVLAEETHRHDHAEPETQQEVLLRVSGLKTQFRQDGRTVTAVDGVSFDVRRGETLAIVGESGSGKSVTAMSILRLIPSPPGEIVDGEVLFDGKDMLGLSDEEIRKMRGSEIAMIFQEPMTSMNPVLTIGRQLSEPIQVHRGGDRKSLLAKCVDLLRKVRIPDPENRVKAYPHQLSGGMRQRAMIAMGLGCDPRLIIADEPTTALDVTVQAQILELLKDLTRERGTSMILITHDLGVVARYADRINVMYAGRIVEQGSSGDIFKHPKHPYTLGLMSSIPRLDQPSGTRLTPITGQPPDLSNLPSGCPFHPRCRFAEDRCRAERPPLTQVSDQHWKACWIDVNKP